MTTKTNLGAPEQIEKNKQDIDNNVDGIDENLTDITILNNKTQNLDETGKVINEPLDNKDISTKEYVDDLREDIPQDWFISSDGTIPTLPTSLTQLIDAKKHDSAFDIIDVAGVEKIVNGYKLSGDDPTILADWIQFDAGGEITLSNYYTKLETDNLLDDKANVDDVYTKTETDNKIIEYVGGKVSITLAPNDTVDLRTLGLKDNFEYDIQGNGLGVFITTPVGTSNGVSYAGRLIKRNGVSTSSNTPNFVILQIINEGYINISFMRYSSVGNTYLTVNYNDNTTNSEVVDQLSYLLWDASDSIIFKNNNTSNNITITFKEK